MRPESGSPVTFEQKGYLFPLPATDLQQWINQGLNLIQHDGTYEAQVGSASVSAVRVEDSCGNSA